MVVVAKTSILPFRRGLVTGQVVLAIATIVSCGIFAAISGVSVATAATIGVVAIPEMIERGYNKKFVYGLLAAGGTLGILIPPSLPMIVYGFITEESVIALFLAGIGTRRISDWIIHLVFDYLRTFLWWLHAKCAGELASASPKHDQGCPNNRAGSIDSWGHLHRSIHSDGGRRLLALR
jgi:hypothetical protein